MEKIILIKDNNTGVDLKEFAKTIIINYYNKQTHTYGDLSVWIAQDEMYLILHLENSQIDVEQHLFTFNSLEKNLDIKIIPVIISKTLKPEYFTKMYTVDHYNLNEKQS